MKSFKRISVVAVLFALAAVLTGLRIGHTKYTHAQIGPASITGYVAAVNAFQPTVIGGAAGTVTNVSTFLMQIDGGPIYCNGNQSSVGESQMFLSANTTYLIVYNCPQELLYAKTAVTGPGSSGTTAGVPTSLLYAISGVEIPIANVVCGASTCATITDQRPLSAFPAGTVQTGSVLFANLPATYPNGAVLYCSNCTLASSPCTGASTGAMALRVNGAWRCQ